MTKIAKLMARVLGCVYLIAAGLAWALPNPLIGAEGLVRTNEAHDLALGILGLIPLACSFGGETVSSMGLYFVALLSAGLAVLGFLATNDAGVGRIAGMVLVNTAAIGFHAAMAVACLISGMSNTASKQVIYE